MDKLTLTIASKILEICLKYSKDHISKRPFFFKILREFNLNIPTDEFNSIYYHALLLLTSDGIPEEFISLFLLEESKEAFKDEKYKDIKGAFILSLNSSLHTNNSNREFKNWNKIPIQYPKAFLKYYKQIVRELSPSNDLMISNQEQIKEEIKGLKDAFEKSSVGIPISEPDVKLLNNLQQDGLAMAKEFLDAGLTKRAIAQLESLKKNFWGKSDNKFKYTLLTNKGISCFQQGKDEEGCNYLIEAFKYGDRSEASYINLISAYLGKKEEEKATTYCKEFQARYPDSPKSLAAKIRLVSYEEFVQNILKDLPEAMLEEFEVQQAIGLNAASSGKFNTSIKYLKKATELSPENSKAKELLLYSILENYTRDFRLLNMRILSDEIKDNLQLASRIIDELLLKFDKSDMDNLLVTLYLNKSVLHYIFEEIPKSFDCLNLAERIDPYNTKIVTQRTILYASQGRIDEAIEILSNIDEKEFTTENTPFRAELLRQYGRIREAKELLEKTLANDLSDISKRHCTFNLVDIYIELSLSSELEKLSGEDFFKSKHPLDLMSKFKILKYLGKEFDEELILTNIYDEAIMLKEDREKFMLAEEFVLLEWPIHAINLYRPIVDLETYHSLTIDFINLLYKNGKKGECLEILLKLKSKKGLHSYASHLEISIYQEYGDYEKAIEVGEQYLVKFEENIAVRLTTIDLLIRLGRTQEADFHLNKISNLKSLTKNEINNFIALLSRRNRSHEMIDVAYHYHRQHKNSDSNDLFIRVGLQFELSGNHFETSDEIKVNFAVNLKSTIDARVFTLILQDSHIDKLEEGDININDPRFGALVGKKINQFVRLPSSNRKWQIISIVDKYEFALKECYDNISTIYAPSSSFKSFHLNELEEIEKLSNSLDWEQQYDAIKRSYKQKQSFIGNIASAIRANPIQLWLDFSSSPSVGIISSNGLKDSYDSVVSSLSKFKTICIDITGLLTVHYLELFELLLDQFENVYISRYTHDLIYEFIQEEGQFLRASNSRVYGDLKDLLELIEKHFEIITSKDALGIDSIEKNLNDKKYGKSFFDTILISREKEALLLSDDYVFREEAVREFGTNGTWTQVILSHWQSANRITKDEYTQRSLKLVQLNYFHTSINHNVLTLAASRAGYNYQNNFEKCLDTLKGKVSSQISAVLVSFNFLYELWLDASISHAKKRSLSIVVITICCNERTICHVLWLLETILKAKYNESKAPQNRYVCRLIDYSLTEWRALYDVPKFPMNLIPFNPPVNSLLAK